MSVLGIMDSRIDVYGINDASVIPTNSLGEAGTSEGVVPAKIQSRIRASIQMHGYGMRSTDQGEGDRSTGYAILYMENKSIAKEGDVIFVMSGPMRDTWWQISDIVFAPSRGQHKETHIKVYYGPRGV